MSLPYAFPNNAGYGTRILTFSTGNANGVAFICNEYDPSEPSAITARLTELGAPNGFVEFAEARTARASLQFATNATACPDRGDELITTRRTTATNGVSNTINVTYVVESLGMPERPRDFWMLDAQLREKI